MNVTLILIIVVVLAVTGIGVSSWVQAREREAAERRQKILFARGSIKEIQDWLAVMGELPLDNSVKSILLDCFALHYQAIRALDASMVLSDYDAWRENIKHQMSEPMSTTTKPLSLPNSANELLPVRTRIHRFAEFVGKLKNFPQLDSNKVVIAFESLVKLKFRIDVEGHIRVGHAELQKKNVPAAKQAFQIASDRLAKENSSDAYVKTQLNFIEEAQKELATLAAIEPSNTTRNLLKRLLR